MAMLSNSIDHFSEGPACSGAERQEKIQWVFSARSQSVTLAFPRHIERDIKFSEIILLSALTGIVNQSLLNQISRLFRNAVPEPDFKYFSNLYALYLSLNAT